MHLTVTSLLLERQLTSTVPHFISFSLPSAPDENKVDDVVSQMQAPVGQCSADPHPVPESSHDQSQT